MSHWKFLTRQDTIEYDTVEKLVTTLKEYPHLT